MNKNIQHTTTFLKDYTPPEFLIDSAHLTFSLDPTNTVVTSELRIRRNPDSKNKGASLILDGISLSLEEAKLNNRVLSPKDYHLTAESLTILNTPNDFVLEITVKISPCDNWTCSGLYLTDKSFCTQNEPHGFRNLTYFIDRPDILTKFTTTIIADRKKYPVLLSNGNLISEEKLKNNKHKAVWQDPFPKSPYLFALVAGNYSWIEDHHTTTSGRKITIRIFTEANQIDQCHHAMESLKQAMRWEEKSFGLEYDLDLYQIVVVNDFNFGAMENKGLNVFNSNLLLASPLTATDADFRRIAAVVAHEYFHNWTGNRITCRDWFQVGLKEGLTTLREQLFMEDTYGKAINRLGSVEYMCNKQFAEDSGPLSHPVRLQSYIEVDNFYTSTIYYKSAEIARMLITIFGRKVFKQIMGDFLTKFDGQAVTIEDFLQSAAKTAGADLTQFKRWYDQAGTPKLIIEDEFIKNKGYILNIKQQHKKTAKDFYIPLALGLINPNGKEILKETLILNDKEQTAVYKDFETAPTLSLLRNFSAPVNVQYAYTESELLFLIAKDKDSISRWDASRKLLTNTIIKLCKIPTPKLPNVLIKMFKSIINDKKIDLSLAAQILRLPTESYLLENLPKTNIEAIHSACEFIKSELANNLKKEFLDCYHANNNLEPYDLDALSIGKREIKNIALYYLIHLNTEEIFSICLKQLKNSDNLTDTIAALTCIANSTYSKREEVLEKYYKKWSKQPNLTNKWLAINANIKSTGNLKRIKKLIDHPAFNIRNPNKVYSLIRAFCENNIINFHTKDGKGYEFLTKQILAIDKLNPPVAALIAISLTRGHKLDKKRKESLQIQINRLRSNPKLSKNVYEILAKVNYI